MSDPQKLTLKQWQRRALKAEAELESIRQIRQFEHSQESKMHKEISVCRVVIQEIREAIEFGERNE